MAVSFDAAVFVEQGAVQTLTTGSFTIGSGSNRAAIVGLSMGTNTATGITVSVGGVSGTLIPGTDSTTANGNCRSLMFYVINPPSGSQTATASWTGSMTAGLGVTTVSGADQTTPANNGTFASGLSGTSPSVSIVSNSGDLTMDTIECADNFPTSPTQTQRWLGSSVIGAAGSTGPGTGNTTHAWSLTGSNWTASGANFVAASAPVGTPSRARTIFVMP